MRVKQEPWLLANSLRPGRSGVVKGTGSLGRPRAVDKADTRTGFTLVLYASRRPAHPPGAGSYPQRPQLALVPSQTTLSLDPMGRVAAPILTSVGQDAVNRPGDVFVIQSLLNDRLPTPHAPVDVTGVADPGTILAIKVYQAVYLNMNPPSGHVDPGSATYYALAARPLVNQAPLASPHFGHVGIVPPEVLSAAQASYAHWHVPTAVTLAQWAVESAWGAAMPPASNNPFGIKAVGAEPFVESQTREVVNGTDVLISAHFRRFEDLAQAFDLHGRLLYSGAPYAGAMKLVADPQGFADALTGVYATDPTYGYTLKWVMNKYGFLNY